MSPETVRLAILVTLVVQNSAQALFMRYSFKPKEEVEGEQKEPEPASSTAVVMAELCKLVCSICLQYRVSEQKNATMPPACHTRYMHASIFLCVYLERACPTSAYVQARKIESLSLIHI